MSFGKKLFLIFVIPMAIGMGLLSFLSFRYEKGEIYRWEIEKNQLISLAISTALRKAMLHDDADRVRELVAELQRTGKYEKLRVLRTSGEEAFLDLKTVGQVEKELGGAQKSWEERHLDIKEIPRLDSPEFKRVIQTGKDITFFEKSGNSTILTSLTPLFNEPDCQVCHGKEEHIRGIIQVSTDISPAEGFVRANLRRNFLISLSILLVITPTTSLIAFNTIYCVLYLN